MVGSRTNFSWGSSSPNNSTNVGATIGGGLSTVIYPSASTSTGTVVDIISGQVYSWRVARKGSGGDSMGDEVGAAVAEMRGGAPPCSLIEP